MQDLFGANTSLLKSHELLLNVLLELDDIHIKQRIRKKTYGTRKIFDTVDNQKEKQINKIQVVI